MERYSKIFLMEASVLHLKDVAGYSRAHIMLMPFTSFNLEISKHNLRLDAQHAERKAQFEIDTAKNRK